MAKKSLAPRQARSRESERKLIQAALKVLETHGLEGTTIPRIAERAGLTPGAVYRRFPDKNALLERVLVATLESSYEHVKATFAPAMTGEKTLPELLELLIASLIPTYRSHPGVLRALRQLVQSTDHLAFRNKVVKIEMRSMQYMVDLLLAYRNEIHHPEPEVALWFAFATLISTLLELFLVDAALGSWPVLIPRDDESLVRELKRMVLRYLGYEGA